VDAVSADARASRAWVAWALWVVLAGALLAFQLDALFRYPSLRFPRLLLTLLALGLGASRPAAGLLALLVMTPAANLITQELLAVPVISLPEHFAVPLCFAALLRAGPPPRQRESRIEMWLLAFIAVALLSSIGVFADVAAAVGKAIPGLAMAVVLENNVFGQFTARVATLKLGKLPPGMWAADALAILTGAALVFRCLIDRAHGVEIRDVERALGIGLAVLTLVTGIQWLFPFNLDTVYYQTVQPGLFRPDSVWSDPNSAAAHALLVAPVVAAGLWAQRRHRAMVLAPLMAGFFVVVLTNSRTAMVAAGVTALLASAWIAWKPAALRLGEQRQVRRRAIAALGAMVFAPVVAVATVTAFDIGRDVTYHSAVSRWQTALFSLNLKHGVDDISTGRVRYWQAGMRMWLSAPWLGIGYGQSALHKNEFRDPESHEMVVWHGVHQAYLELASELGMAGIVVFAGLAAAIATGLRRLLASPVLSHRRRAAGLAAALAAVAVVSLAADWIWRRDAAVLLWACVALVPLALKKNSDATPPDE